MWNFSLEKWNKYRVIAVCFAVILSGSGAVSPSVSAAEMPLEAVSKPTNEYNAYKNTFTDWTDAEEEIIIAAPDYSGESESGAVPEGSALKWDSQTGTVTYKTEIPRDAIYIIKLTYKQLPCRGNPIQLGIKIDGEYPFGGTSAIELPRLWTNDGGVRKDSAGNEFTSEQIELYEFQTQPLRDSEGAFSEPYEFAISAGTHEITLEMREEAFLLREIILSPPESVENYAEIKLRQGDLSKYSGEPIRVQGEDADKKTSRSMPALSDNREASLTPASATKTKLNYIGGARWSDPGQTLSWTIDVPESGLYKLAFKFKQSLLINGVSYRQLKIDGKGLFTEAANIPFSYSTNWQFKEFSDENNEPYLIYLEKGERVFSLSVTLSEIAEVYARLEEQTTRLGDLYLDIAMITGETPDANRDYDLFRQIPDFNETLTEVRKQLISLAADIQKTSGKRGGSIVAALNNMCRVLKTMLDNPYTAQQYKTDYYNNYTSLGSWLYEMKSMPLRLDEFVLAAPDYKFGRETAGFFQSVGFAVTRFIYSFQSDYRVLSGGAGEGPSIKLWVDWGRDQTQILNALIQESFTAETGINVNLEIVNAGIIKGMLSGNPPDLSLHMARTEPVNLAMRGALVDLNKFPDYKQVMERFAPGAGMPYEYGGGSYALPDTQAFYVMFYRTDIFETLNLKAPKTWDEFRDAAVTIQRSNMNVWIPYTRIATATTVNTGIGGLSLFPSLMLQNGLSLYDESLEGAALNQTRATQVFTDWTNMYTRYKLPREVSFYNRFRVGTMPLGIEVYTLYQTLVDAAPEIQNRWSIAQVPGTAQEDGTIKNTVSGSGTGAGIIAETGKEEYAWEFLKWWTRADIQATYSNNVESILGVVGRTASATVDALSEMSWKSEDLEVIYAQWEKVEELPELPGGYYLSRALDQAFWNVTNGYSNAKDSITTWNAVADNEIKRKIKEYSE